MSDVLSVIRSATPDETRAAEQLLPGARAVAFSTTPGLLLLLRATGAALTLVWQPEEDRGSARFEARSGVHDAAELLHDSRGVVRVPSQERSTPGVASRDLDGDICELLRAWCERAALDGGSQNDEAFAARVDALEQTTEVVCALQLRSGALVATQVQDDTRL